MTIKKWLKQNTNSLADKTVAITGSTGGIGRELVFYLARLSAKIILIDRNLSRSLALKKEIEDSFQGAFVKCITLDLEDVNALMLTTESLKSENIDIIIFNAGAYKIPRRKCASGLDNIFQINFMSPYYMIKELLPSLSARRGRVVVVGSIAHDYSRADSDDVDFSTRSKCSLVYGNAKRYLMFSLYKLFSSVDDVSLAVTHPGITFTNITAHYPKIIFALIKHPMKVIFMKPAKASLSILQGIFKSTEYCEWIGPSLFNIWGYPKKKILNTAKTEEIEEIFSTAEKLYGQIKMGCK